MKTIAEFMVLPKIESAVKKNFLGKKKIAYHDYLKICALVYENAALIGNSIRDKAELIAKLINVSDQKLVSLRESVIARNESITPKTMANANKGKTDYIRANSFSWFIAKSELTKFQLKNTTMGFSDTFFTLNALELVRNEKAETEIKKLLGQRITLDEELINYAVSLCEEGFIYGIQYPDSTSEMYNKTYAVSDISNWKKLHRGALMLGLISVDSEKLTIEKMELKLLNYVREYIREYIPDLDF